MDLAKTLRGIQYQTAKLEVIELMFWSGKNSQPSLEAEVAYNTVSSIRQNLFSASESCFDASLESMSSHVASLQDTLVSANNFLIQMSSGSTSTDAQVIFVKELFNSIVMELVKLNTELSNLDSQAFQQPSDNSTSAAQFIDSNEQDSADREIEQKFKNLINKCMGDTERAERLIQYEFRRHRDLDREGAIQAAITRWESDNR